MTLQISDLTIDIHGRRVVDEVSLTVADGERLGLIGESGSGKSLTALAVLGLLPRGATVAGSIRLDGRELVGLGRRPLAAIRGRHVGIVFQEPATALNPVRRIGPQISEAPRIHGLLTRGQARARAVELAARVGLPDPEHIVDLYPHQLSGGQRQRVAIAIALSAGPRLLIADEPTTALDVTIQGRILELFDETVRDAGAALLFITHDLSVLSQITRDAVVMSDGRVVERGTVRDIVHDPQHPVTAALAEAARATSWSEVAA